MVMKLDQVGHLVTDQRIRFPYIFSKLDICINSNDRRYFFLLTIGAVGTTRIPVCIIKLLKHE